jgi:hypothetical protein
MYEISSEIKEYLSFIRQEADFVDDSRPNDIVIRCPFCGDSRKNKNKGHLYVSRTIPVWYCHRCNLYGSLEYLLLYFGWTKPIQISHSKTFARKGKIKTFLESKPILPKFELGDQYVDQGKLQYLYGRHMLGEEQSWEDIGVVFSVTSFLEVNQIQGVDGIDESSIGFLSSDQGGMIVRFLDKDDKERYRRITFSPQRPCWKYVRTQFNNIRLVREDFCFSQYCLIAEGIPDALNVLNRGDILEGISDALAVDLLGTDILCVVAGKDLLFGLDICCLTTYNFLPKVIILKQQDFEIRKNVMQLLNSNCEHVDVLTNLHGEDFACETVKPIVSIQK